MTTALWHKSCDEPSHDSEKKTERIPEQFGGVCICAEANILSKFQSGGALMNVVCFIYDLQHLKLGDHQGPWSEFRPKSELQDDFRDCSDNLRALVASFENPSIWGIFDLPVIEEWTDERMVLIGDAGHAMTPHRLQASGAGQATEDALFLPAVLLPPKPKTVLQQSRRHCCIFAWVAGGRVTSRKAGLLYDFRGVNGKGEDVEKIRKAFHGRINWIWEYELEGKLNAALLKLKEA